MQIRLSLNYREFEHALSDAAVSIRRIGEFNDAGVAYANREMWFIQGRLEGSSQAEITNQIQLLELAYNRPLREISLRFEDGTATAHSMDVRNSLDGIRVTMAPGYPTGEGAEYANFR